MSKHWENLIDKAKTIITWILLVLGLFVPLAWEGLGLLL